MTHSMTQGNGRRNGGWFGDQRLIVAVLCLIGLLLHVTSASAGGTTGLTTTSLDNLRNSVIGYAETWGRPIGIFLVIGGALLLLRSVGGGLVGIIAGLIAVLAVGIIDEANTAAAGASFTLSAAPTLKDMGPIHWALSFYGYLILRVSSAVEVWATLPAVMAARRFIRVCRHA